MSISKTMLDLYSGLADCLNNVGAFDEQGLSEDGTAYIVADGVLYRIEMTAITDDGEG